MKTRRNYDFRKNIVCTLRPSKETGKVDVAQLLYYLDSGHFAEFLHRYRSDHYVENSAIFEAGGTDVGDVQMQWEDKRVKRRAAAMAGS